MRMLTFLFFSDVPSEFFFFLTFHLKFQKYAKYKEYEECEDYTEYYVD